LTPGLPTGTPPIFDRVSPGSCGETFDWVSDKRLDINISAKDTDAGDTVTLNAVGLPSGAVMQPALPVSGNPISSSFDWQPGSADAGPHVIVFIAQDQTGLQSQCPIIVDVKVDSDGDGIPDSWERFGYFFNGKFVDLPAMGADPNHKDI